eukprot:9460667-Ditylum_brightwellii.AAC.1
MAGNFGTDAKHKITFVLPELNPTVHIECTMHITNNLGRYNMVLGRDVQQSLGIEPDFKQNNIIWDDCLADMKFADVTLAECLNNTEVTKMITENMSKVLDAKYRKVDLHREVVNQCSTLEEVDKEKSLCVLKEHKELLDSTPDIWKSFKYDIELQDGTKLYHSQQYTVPKAYKTTLHMEVNRLCHIEVLHKVNQSE